MSCRRFYVDVLKKQDILQPQDFKHTEISMLGCKQQVHNPATKALVKPLMIFFFPFFSKPHP